MREPDRRHKRAKSLRANMSLPEVLLWRELKRSAGPGPQFRRQHPIGPYVLDFYCAKARLCIEVDGQAHGTDDRPARDDRRDCYLADLGIHVERISATAVLQDPHAIANGLTTLATERIAAAERPLSQLR
jgi:very-short-patch-repair endonuclease